MVTLAVPLFERRGLDTALAMLDEAESLATAAGPDGDSLRGLAAIQRAGFLARSGRWAQAVTALEDVRADGDLVGDREVAVALLNRGLARQYLGQFRESADDLRAASDVAGRAELDDVRSMAVHNLGCLSLLRGEVPEALRLMSEAHALAPENSVAAMRLDVARAHLEAGLVQEATAQLREALVIASDHELSQTHGEILLELARCAAVRGEPAEAVAAAARAADHFRDHGVPVWAVHADVLLARARLAVGERDPELLRSVDALDAGSVQSPVVREHAALVRAEAALVRGDPHEARRRLEPVRGRRRLVLTDQLHHDLVTARIADASGEAERAARALRRASLRLARSSAAYSGPDIRTAVALHGRRLAALDLERALATGRASAVYAATERWRAPSLRLPAAVVSDDDRLRDLVSRLRMTRRRLDEAPEHEAARLRDEARHLEGAVSRREREVTDRTDVGAVSARPLRLAELRRSLAARDATAVLVFSHGGRLRAVTVTGRDTTVHDLGAAADASELSRRLRADLRAATVASVPELAEVIRRSVRTHLDRIGALLAPALSVGGERLVVVPSVDLPSVPWRMVPGVEGRPLVVAGSATSWARRSGSSRAEGVVAVGGPSVPTADAEVAAVLEAWGRGRALAGPAATAAAVTEAMAGADVVHVAAHGTHHDESPLFSSVRLEDGPLFAHELHRRGVRAQHVVLASCDVGTAHLRPGDEALGLTASLLSAGARSVLAAVAPVDDAVSHTVVTRYHRLLRDGTDAALALERAAGDVPGAGLFALHGADWSRSDPPPGRSPGPPVGS